MKKNYLVSAAVCVAAFLFASSGVKAQTIDLFNGKDLSNWKFVLENDTKKAEDVFFIKDGNIHIAGTPFGYMCTNDKYSNFRLHVEWRYPYGEATNSGIFLFVQDDDKADPNFVWPNGVECQLHVGDAGDFVLLNGSDLAEFILPAGQKRPAFPVVKKRGNSAEMPTGEWNNADISCQNGNITVFVNGRFMNQGSKSKHKTGRIGLQSEGKDIQFRNVRLTPTK